jgi:RNA polymerase sigma factor (sigma-70 family)
MDRRYEQFNEMTFESYIKRAIDNAVNKVSKKQTEREEWERSLSSVTDADLYSISPKDAEIKSVGQTGRVFRVQGEDVSVYDEKLGEVLLSLLPKDRKVILMYYFLKMTDEKISHVLGVTRAAVQQRRNNAMKKLHALLEDST